MSRKIVIIGTLDTKGPEHWFLKEKTEEMGLGTIVMDTGIMDPPRFNPDMPPEEVSRGWPSVRGGAGIGITAKFAESGDADLERAIQSETEAFKSKSLKRGRD